MLFEALKLLKWMPKISMFYVVFSLLNGMGISYMVLGVVGFCDLIDYIPMD